MRLPCALLLSSLLLAPAGHADLLGMPAEAGVDSAPLEAAPRPGALEAPPSLTSPEARAGLIGWALGEAGALLFPLQYAVLAAANPRPVALTEDQKAALRPSFGGLVDQVRVSYSANSPDGALRALVQDAIERSRTLQWLRDHGYLKYLPPLEIAARVMGTHLFVTTAHAPGEVGQLRTLFHEMVHVEQYRRAGSTLAAQGRAYYRAYYEAGGYGPHPMEVEARERAQAARLPL